jgi:hypothetical protein
VREMGLAEYWAKKMFVINDMPEKFGDYKLLIDAVENERILSWLRLGFVLGAVCIAVVFGYLVLMVIKIASLKLGLIIFVGAVFLYVIYYKVFEMLIERLYYNLYCVAERIELDTVSSRLRSVFLTVGEVDEYVEDGGDSIGRVCNWIALRLSNLAGKDCKHKG